MTSALLMLGVIGIGCGFVLLLALIEVLIAGACDLVDGGLW